MYIIITNETRYVCRREDDFRLFNLLTLKACRPRQGRNVRGSRGRRQGLRQKKIRNCYFGENDWHAVEALVLLEQFAFPWNEFWNQQPRNQCRLQPNV